MTSNEMIQAEAARGVLDRDWHDVNEPAMHYQVARSKKWTGWDYAIGIRREDGFSSAQGRWTGTLLSLRC